MNNGLFINLKLNGTTSNGLIKLEGVNGTGPIEMLSHLISVPITHEAERIADVTIADIAPIGTEWEKWTCLFPFDGTMFWIPDKLRFHIQLNRPVNSRENTSLRIIRRAFFLALLPAIMNQKMIIMHGTLLKMPTSGNGYIVFGESGMGKSTLSRRFETQGGTFLSDDKMLVIRQYDGSLTAQPTPTWSNWGRHDFAVNFNDYANIRGMLTLTRGEDDRIQSVDSIKWNLGFASSLGNVLVYPPQWLPQALKKKLLVQEMSFATDFPSRFGYHEIQGALDGHIMEHLKTCYQDS